MTHAYDLWNTPHHRQWHLLVWHDSSICVTWLIHMCDMTLFICVTWLIHMCDMTYSYVWHDSFMCVTWHGIFTFNVPWLTYSHVICMSHVTRMKCAMTHIFHSSAKTHDHPPLWIMQKYLRAGPAQMPLGNWYPAGTYNFHPKDVCRAEMKKPTMLSNKNSTAWSCAEDQILENKIPGTGN